MKKIFTRSLILYMAIALVISIFAVFLLQTALTSASNTKSAREKLAVVSEKLDSNDAEIKRLTENVGENNLAKTRAFADLLQADTSIFGNQEKLTEVCNRLMVNEVHIIDENGIIVSSSIPEYVGFDMGSGDQSAAFLVILDDPSVELVQEPMMNVIEQKVTQYIGVTRKDAPGFVQVGIEPEIMAQALASTKTDTVLAEFDYGVNGFIWAVDLSDGTVAAHKNADLVGKTAAEAGLVTSMGTGRIRTDGVKGYYVAQQRGDLLIGTFLPVNEYYSARLMQTLLISIDLVIVFVALMILINRLVDRQIISGVKRIENGLRTIAGGDFSITVDERSNPEFAQFSDDINTMVGSIREYIGENETLMEKQRGDMEHTLSMIDRIKEVCANLEQMSKMTLNSSNDISRGASDQKEAVEALDAVMEELKKKIHSSANDTVRVTDATDAARGKIQATEGQMKELVASIENITDISKQIETIIDEINGIASQTSLLALNASIEAARAGDAGRGFAVVATEVGALATRSAQAAQETNDLITRSMSAVEAGMRLAESTVGTFDEAVRSIETIDTEAEDISESVRSNVAILTEAEKKIEEIETVLDANIEISQTSKALSENMAGVTEKLLDIVGTK